jgi:predicted dinucleotide-binding enzyme
MNIGILGSGVVAQSLARGFLERGDSVMLGTRDTAKLADWRSAAQGDARVGSFAEATAFGELNVLATLGTATVAIIQDVGSWPFADKVVIDATNPLGYEGGPHLTIGLNDSLGERVQRALPKALVVKAFNTVGNANFVRPKLTGGPPTMFIGGNDDNAKREVERILRDFGWDSADLGDITTSRYLEPMGMAWVAYAFKNDVWTHAFKLLNSAP